MSNRTALKAGNIITYVIMVVVNILANALPLFGRATGEISDAQPNLFVPAGYVFAIWGLIYLALGAFVIWQALPAQKDDPVIEKIGIFFILGNLFNTAWVFAWHSLMFPLTEVFMLGLLVSLAVIYARLKLSGDRYTDVKRWTVWTPFAIYLGWISVATIANTAITLLALGWDGFGIAPEVWTMVMLTIASLLASYITIVRKELPYTLVIIWALIGIALKQAGIPLISTAAWVFTVIVTLILVGSFFTRMTAKKTA